MPLIPQQPMPPAGTATEGRVFTVWTHLLAT